MGKFSDVSEVFLITAAIMFRIWFPMPLFFTILFTLIILAAIVLSSISKKEDWESVGLKPKDWNTWPIVRLVAIASITIIFIVGLWADSSFLSKFPGLIFKITKSVIGYFFWALFQQLLLNGYLLNRLQALLKDKNMSIFGTAVIFSMIHLPNLLLILLTFFGGVFSGHLFFKSRNIYVLAFIHALWAALISHLWPAEWHHYLIIGPRFIE